MVDGRLRYHFVLPVWGRKFVDLFLDLSLPNQFQSGNLPAFAGTDALYRIYTSAADLDRIRRSPELRRLERLMPVSLEVVEANQGSHKWGTMTECHQRALSAASDDRDAIVFLLPDLLMSRGSLGALRRAADAGKRLVAVFILPVMRDAFLRELAPMGGFALSSESLEPSTMVRAALSTMHPMLGVLFWEREAVAPCLPTLCWDTGGGLLARTLQPHPLLVRPRDRTVRIERTFDDDYVLATLPASSEMHAFEDSDELTICSLEDDPSKGFPVPVGPPSTLRYAWWLHTQPVLRYPFFRHRYWFHTDGREGELASARARSDKVVRRVLACALAARRGSWLIEPLREQRRRLKRLAARA